MRWTGRFGIALADYPNAQAFVERMEKREAMQQALAEEGLDKVAQA